MAAAARMLLSHGGRDRTVRGWARMLGVPPGVIRGRLASGMPVAEAVTSPARDGEGSGAGWPLARIPHDKLRARWAGLLGVPLETFF